MGMTPFPTVPGRRARGSGPAHGASPGRRRRSTPPCRSTRSILQSGGVVRAIGSSARAAPPAAPLRVLVVDDHPGFRSTACELLEARGYRVVGDAACAASTLEAVASLCPDAVLLDVRLGGDCGFALAHALACCCPAPAVLLTSTDDDGDAGERARASEARGFVLKSDLVRTDFRRFWP